MRFQGRSKRLAYTYYMWKEIELLGFYISESANFKWFSWYAIEF